MAKVLHLTLAVVEEGVAFSLMDLAQQEEVLRMDTDMEREAADTVINLATKGSSYWTS